MSETKFPLDGTGLTLNSDSEWGISMATTPDGSVIAIGGPFQDGASGSGTSNTGVVQVYNVDLSVNPPTYAQKGGNIIGGAQFGRDLEISTDGNRIWIGGYRIIAIYDYDGSSWTSVQEFSGGELGREFAVTTNSVYEGKYLAAYLETFTGILTKHLRLYENTAASFTDTPNYVERFDFATTSTEPGTGGDECKIFWDGNTVGTGTYNLFVLQGRQEDNTAQLWQLNNDNNGFDVVQTFTSPTGGGGWGRCVGSTGDGTTIAIGSLNANVVQVWNTTTAALYTTPASTVTDPYTLTDTITGPNSGGHRFGSSVAVAENQQVVIGEPYYDTGNNGVGAVYFSEPVNNGGTIEYSDPVLMIQGAVAGVRLGTETQVNNDMKLILAGGVNSTSDSAVSFASNSPMCLPGFVKVIKMVEEDEQ